MLFVSSSANLRMISYNININSEFENKGIAGNIIHAIATTNAIAGGLLVSQGLLLLQEMAKYNKNNNENKKVSFKFSPHSYTSYQPALTTQQEFNKLLTVVSNKLSLNWIKSELISASEPENPKIDCYCAKPQILSSFSYQNNDPNTGENSDDMNIFNHITFQTYMLLIEGMIGGIGSFYLNKTLFPDHKDISMIFNQQVKTLKSKDGSIEDYSFDKLSGDEVTLGSRDDGFWFKYYNDIKDLKSYVNNEKIKNNDSDNDDGLSQDEINPIIFRKLGDNNIQHGSIIQLQQVLDYTQIINKIYDNNIIPINSALQGLYTIPYQYNNELFDLILSQSHHLVQNIVQIESFIRNDNNDDLLFVQCVLKNTNSNGNNLVLSFWFNIQRILSFQLQFKLHRELQQQYESEQFEKEQKLKLLSIQQSNNTIQTSIDIDTIPHDILDSESEVENINQKRQKVMDNVNENHPKDADFVCLGNDNDDDDVIE
jgi:hypothetical protein